MPASTAARWASWVAAGRPSPPAGGPASNLGVSFLPGLFGPNPRIIVEAAFGADLGADETTWNWIDLTSVVYFSTKITIVQGRTDNTSTAQPGTCSLTFTNDAGNLTPYHPASVYYPNVRRGTPLRVRVDLDLGTGPVVLYQGSIASMTPTWDVTGKLALVAVTAGGTTRRLTQGKTPLKSPLYRAITALSPTAYWPLGDAAGALVAASAVTGQPGLAVSGAVTFGATGPAGAVSGADLTGGGTLAAPIRSAASGSFRLAFAARLTNAAVDSTPARIYTSTGLAIEFQLQASIGNLAVTVTDVTGGSAGPFYLAGEFATYDTDWHMWQFTLVQSGSFVNLGFYMDQTLIGTLFGGTAYSIGRPSSILLNPSGSTTLLLSDTAVFTPTALTTTDALTVGDAASGFSGEDAVGRLERLCIEEGINLSVIGTSNIGMGPQSTADIMTVLRESETADIGVLFDGFGSGIGYRSRSSWYNLAAALTIDAAAGRVGVPFSPVDDDQRLRNDATVTRGGGTSAEVTDTDGPNGTAGPGRPGVYDTSLTVNVVSDDLVGNIAGWIVRLGTVEGLRYPTLAFDFAATPALAQPWLNAGTPGFRIDVTNMDAVVAQHPPDDISLIVEGWAMQLDTTRWTVTANCSAFEPFIVPVLNDPVLGKLGTNSTSQHDGWDGVSGSFTIDTATGPLWSTDPAQYPVDLNLAGQRVTVSGCSGGSNPQTLTVSVASVNGISKSHPPGEAVTLWYRLRPAL